MPSHRKMWTNKLRQRQTKVYSQVAWSNRLISPRSNLPTSPTHSGSWWCPKLVKSTLWHANTATHNSQISCGAWNDDFFETTGHDRNDYKTPLQTNTTMFFEHTTNLGGKVRGGSFSSSFPHSKIPGIFQDSSYETGILVISMSLSAHKTSSTLTVPQICKRKNHPLLEFSGQSGHGMILPLLRNSRGHTHDSPFSHELSRATCWCWSKWASS